MAKVNQPCKDLIYVERVYLPEPCINLTRSVRTSVPWERFRTKNQCDDINFLIRNGVFTQHDLAMRRKAEILKYKYQQFGITKKMQFVNAVNTKKTSISRINRLKNPCEKNPGKIIASASASNVPGGGFLWLDNTIPFIPIGSNKRPSYSTNDNNYI